MKVFLFVSIILLIFQGTAIAYEGPVKHIQLIDNGEAKTLRTRSRTVEDFLTANDLTLHEQDMSNLDLNHILVDEDLIVINRSFNVNVIAGYRQMSVKVSPGTDVNNLINIVSERTGNQYIHNGYVYRELIENETVRLIHVSQEYVNTEEPVYYETEIIYNDDLTYGEENILTYGVLGLKAITTLISFENGDEVSREVLEEKVINYPINEVKELGTKKTVLTSSGHLQYLNSYILEATAYSAEQPNLSNYTATGARAVRGVVAVDPNFIPLGTNLYIPGYGHAVAADTGGAIRGKKIDLCFDTVAESIEFGRRNIKVYVLK